jgi:hypothetical protein
MFNESCFETNENSAVDTNKTVIVDTTTPVVAKKRGRKSKKDIEEAKQHSITNALIIIKNDDENIVVKIVENRIVENNDENNDENITEEKPDINCVNEIVIYENDTGLDLNVDNNLSDIDKQICTENAIVGKKRGRKPKGGKIIQQIVPLNNSKEIKQNIILHLKCSVKDLKSVNLFGSNLDGYSFSQTNNLSYDVVSGENINECLETVSAEFEGEIDVIQNNCNNKNKITENKDICKKLKILEHNLHVNNVDNKKSACFWDTCEFDNTPVSIPKHFINDTYHVYGCFCSPECAVAYLMEENIDSSFKFERYQLMNHIYSKVYNYTKNIKPAPTPYYTLDKYYGNLNIQEYRALLGFERLFLVVDKPLTRIMPELHADNDDFIISNKIIPTNNTKLMKTFNNQTKTNIMKERFGSTQH